ncbi:hypothetical protein OTU49_007638, partial [Cherax quadricarinatus]
DKCSIENHAVEAGRDDKKDSSIISIKNIEKSEDSLVSDIKNKKKNQHKDSDDEVDDDGEDGSTEDDGDKCSTENHDVEARRGDIQDSNIISIKNTEKSEDSLGSNIKNENEKEKINKREEKEMLELSEDMDRRLRDMTQDYARGEVLFSDDSSDDDSTSDEGLDIGEFDWGEFDKDAVWDNETHDVEETSRFAVCNLDWDYINAADIMMVFSSFCPRGGYVKKVTIYPSEYGKQRMAEEDLSGPQELKSVPCSKAQDSNIDLVDLDKLEKGKLDEKAGATKSHHEALRQYQRNRLRYYYAVVECNSVDTASLLYQTCDRKAFEGNGILLDLRYIPTDMTFDETPHDVCEEVPTSYKVKNMNLTTLYETRPVLTWDKTNPERKKILTQEMSKAMKGEAIDEDCLKAYIASS